MSDAPSAPPTFTDPSLVGDEDDLDLAPPGAGVEAQLEPGAEPTDPDDLLAAAEAAMTAPMVKPPLKLEVVGRPGFVVEYDVNVDEPELRVYERRASHGRQGQERIDNLAFGCIVIANRCRAIYYRNELVVDGAVPRTFASKRMHQLFGVDGARNAVRKFLGDPGANSHADAILEAAGYGERARVVDPTQTL